MNQLDMFVSILLEKQLADYPVTEVAILAFLLFHDAMDILHRKVLVGKFGMAVHAILAGKLFCRKRIGSADSQNTGQGKNQPYNQV